MDCVYSPTFGTYGPVRINMDVESDLQTDAVEPVDALTFKENLALGASSIFLLPQGLRKLFEPDNVARNVAIIPPEQQIHNQISAYQAAYRFACDFYNQNGAVIPEILTSVALLGIFVYYFTEYAQYISPEIDLSDDIV